MYKILIEKEAEQEVEGQHNYYKLFVSDQVAADFLKDYNSRLIRIAYNPLGFPLYKNKYHKCVFRKFKHSLYFYIDDDYIKVIAILHQSRDVFKILNKR